MNFPAENTGTPSSRVQKFGRYQVVKLLGEGAMGRVYLAEDPVLQRLVALKVIALDRMVDNETRTEFFERFNVEARASAKLNHSSIVTIHDAGEDLGVPWIAFEFVKGMPLDQLLRLEKPLSFKKIRIICTQLASALEYAHEMHIVHRDIKPQNILIDERTHAAKLADFGVAKAPWVGLTREGTSVGSPGYMSPEQIEGMQIDSRSDLFSLGIVIYEMITGKHPFLKETVQATFFATLNGEYTPVLELRPDTPLNLVSIVDALLQSDRTNRIQSAAELPLLIGNSSTAIPAHSSKSSQDTPLHINTALSKVILRLQYIQKSAVVTTIAKQSKKLSESIYRTVLSYIPLVRKWCKKSCTLVVLKVRSTMPTAEVFFLKHKKLVFALLMAIIPLLFIPVVINHGTKQKKTGLSPKKSSVVFDKVKEDVEKYFSEKNLDSVQMVTSEFIKKYGDNVEINFIQARVALKNEHYTEALEKFNVLVKASGNIVLDRNKKVILEDLELLFRGGESQDELITICAQPLKSIVTPMLDDWLNHSHYWIRWNAVSVCKKLDRKVDMVKVYILDLQTASSIRTRIRAVEKLGELGDKRAIEPLETVSNRGFRDLFVSTAASNVLKKYFNR